MSCWWREREIERDEGNTRPGRCIDSAGSPKKAGSHQEQDQQVAPPNLGLVAFSSGGARPRGLHFFFFLVDMRKPLAVVHIARTPPVRRPSGGEEGGGGGLRNHDHVVPGTVEGTFPACDPLLAYAAGWDRTGRLYCTLGRLFSLCSGMIIPPPLPPYRPLQSWEKGSSLAFTSMCKSAPMRLTQERVDLVEAISRAAPTKRRTQGVCRGEHAAKHTKCRNVR